MVKNHSRVGSGFRWWFQSGGLVLVCLWLFCTALFADVVQSSEPPPAANSPGVIEIPSPESIIGGMSLEEKVGQLMLVGFAGTEVTADITKWVRERKVGGVVLFARNIENLEQIAKFTRSLHGLSADGVPLFLGLDQEGGNVIRLQDGAMLLPGNMALGAARSPMLSYVAGQGLGVDLKRIGFNVNLAPVLDVNSNPRNPVIGVRSYGERADLVGTLGAWFVRGQQEVGIVGVAKHFPGHGNTFGDSHFSMPASYVDKERLFELELEPFRAAIDAGVDAIMTAHIALPRIAESSHVPATLSRNVITGILREELGFEGVVITDGLEMQGIVEGYGSGRAAVMALLAGADMPMILWTAKKKEEVYRALMTAARDGTISEARLNESVTRILTLKINRGLFGRELEDYDTVVRMRNYNPIHEQVSQRIAREAVTLVRNHGDMLPLRKSRYRKVIVMSPAGPFAEAMSAQKYVDWIKVPFVPSRNRRQVGVRQVVEAARDADGVVVVASNRYHVAMIQEIVAQLPNTPTVMLSFASPYYLTSVPSVDAYVCTYSYRRVAQVAAAEAILGEAKMTGRLPVSIPGFYSYGHRVEDRLAGIPPRALTID